jgi:hypothetical protein
MGAGTYSLFRASTTAASYTNLSRDEIFSSRNINNAMNPYGVKVRESRDSTEHPESYAIILGLDVTGSMGSVPHFLVKKGFNQIMEDIIKAGEKDPQVMFVAVGDHEFDSSPLQVGQFESSDELLDKWLTDVYLEGGGGSNEGESYSLAWYFAGNHTSIDCFEKRSRKGILFTIGDEPVLKKISKKKVAAIMGEGEHRDWDVAELLDKARETYDVYHIHVKATGAGSRQSTIDGWKQLMGDNLLIANRQEDVAKLISDTVVKHKQTSTATKHNAEEIL